MVSLSAPIGHPETRALLCTSVQRGGRSVRYKRLQKKSKLHPLHSLVESAGTGLPCTATLWSRKTEHLASSRARIETDPPCTCA
jgi:hypothetical protein